MTENGTFPEGIIHHGRLCREFTLVPESFRHSLEIFNDPVSGPLAAADEAYFSAALFARRLTVAGLDKVTAEQVLDLSRADGQELLMAAGRSEARRLEFRGAAQAAPDAPGGAAETGAGLAEHP